MSVVEPSVTDEVERERIANEECERLIDALVVAVEPIVSWGGDLPGDLFVSLLQRRLADTYPSIDPAKR